MPDENIAKFRQKIADIERGMLEAEAALEFATDASVAVGVTARPEIAKAKADVARFKTQHQGLKRALEKYETKLRQIK